MAQAEYNDYFVDNTGLEQVEVEHDNRSKINKVCDLKFKTELLKADSSERIKKALKSRIPSYNDMIFERGEKVFFRNEKENWDGPAEVIYHDGQTVWIKIYGNMRKVATSRILKFYDEKKTEISEAEKEKPESTNDIDPKNGDIEVPNADDEITQLPQIEQSNEKTNAFEETPIKVDKFHEAPNSEQELPDVALACDDKQIKIHEHINSSNSPVFVNYILKIEKSEKEVQTMKSNFIKNKDLCYSCSLCMKNFRTKSKLKTHIQQIHKSFLFVHEGKIDFSYDPDFVENLNVPSDCNNFMKDKTSITNENYACKMCMKNFETKCELKAHVQHIHKRFLFNYECYAKVINNPKCYFVKKRMTKTSKKSIKRRKLFYSCDICEKTFLNNHELKVHVKLVHKNLLFDMGNFFQTERRVKIGEMKSKRKKPFRSTEDWKKRRKYKAS